MKLREIMTRNVEMIFPETSVQEAAQKMSAWDVGILPVVENGAPVGTVTDRDITIRLTATGRNAGMTRVREVMTPDPVCCFEEDYVSKALKLMAKRQVRRLLVVDRKQRLVGVVSLGDLALKTKDEKLLGHLLKEVSLTLPRDIPVAA